MMINKETNSSSFKMSKGSSNYYKTKLCPLFTLGMCRKELKCKYAHSQEELREKPNLTKTKLCIEFHKTGSCKNETTCKYAHGENDLRSTPEFFKTALCFHYQQLENYYSNDSTYLDENDDEQYYFDDQNSINFINYSEDFYDYEYQQAIENLNLFQPFSLPNYYNNFPNYNQNPFFNQYQTEGNFL